MNLKSELQEDGQQKKNFESDDSFIHVLQPNIDVSLVAFKTVGDETIYLISILLVPVGTMRTVLFSNAQ